MGSSMCTLWLVVLSLGALGVLVSSYCCSSYGDANPFSSLGPFSSSSTGNPVLSPMDGCEHPFCNCQALAEPLRRQLYQVSVFYLFVCLFCFILFCFETGFPLYSPGCPGTRFVDQAGLELRNLPASKGICHHARLSPIFLKLLLTSSSFIWISSYIYFFLYFAFVAH